MTTNLHCEISYIEACHIYWLRGVARINMNVTYIDLIKIDLTKIDLPSLVRLTLDVMLH